MKLKLFFATMLALFLTSCTTKAHLGYTPVTLQQEKNNIELTVNTLQDERAEKQYVGYLRNLYWMPIVKIATDDDVQAWVTNARKTELTRAGYFITQEGESSPYIIEEKILKSIANSYFTYTSSLQAELALKKAEEVIFKKLYTVSEGNGMNWIAQSSSCVQALEKSLQELSTQFIKDVNLALADHHKKSSERTFVKTTP